HAWLVEGSAPGPLAETIRQRSGARGGRARWRARGLRSLPPRLRPPAHGHRDDADGCRGPRYVAEGSRGDLAVLARDRLGGADRRSVAAAGPPAPPLAARAATDVLHGRRCTLGAPGRRGRRACGA